MTSATRIPALFLDRDGVINRDHGYVHRIEEFEFIDGIFDLCREAVARAYPIVIITNQAGIGRGYFTESDFEHLMDWVRGQFAARDVPITAIYHCPFHPTHGVGPYKAESPFRKPGPGMILQAASELSLDLSRSILIGDKMSDCVAGFRAGVGNCMLIEGGKTLNDMSADPGMPPPRNVADLSAALKQVNAIWTTI